MNTQRDRVTFLRAQVLGGRKTTPASSLPGERPASLFGKTATLEPRYDPGMLCELLEHSTSLRPNIDAYAVNIDGFGHRFEAAIDLEAEDVLEQIADSMDAERPDDAPEPTPADVQARFDQLKRIARREKTRLEAFFRTCCEDISFVELRQRMRQDLETTGNAYWEVIRNLKGEPARFVHVAPQMIRPLALDPEMVEVQERFAVSPIAFETIPTVRQFRRFVQIRESECIYFKSFGDPRPISRTTGQVVSGEEDPRLLATELVHFSIYSALSPIGVPRWIGNTLSVLGSRSAEEVNYDYFENKSVPPLAMLVTGGHLPESSIPQIERFVEDNIKGKNNFHKILIVEADTMAGNDPSKARIELKPLRDAQQDDALFQHYDERNIDKVGSAFRLPRLLRGESKDFNRSVAIESLRFAEDQVFQPERNRFDYFMNRQILPEMGIRFWQFRSQTPITRDPDRLHTMIEGLARVGVLTPAEGRVLAEDVFNRRLPTIRDDWTRRPLTLTLAGVQNQVSTPDGDGRPDLSKNGLMRDARQLAALQEELRAEEARVVERRAELARRYAQAEPEPEVVTVPSEVWRSWFEEPRRD